MQLRPPNIRRPVAPLSVLVLVPLLVLVLVLVLALALVVLTGCLDLPRPRSQASDELWDEIDHWQWTVGHLGMKALAQAAFPSFWVPLRVASLVRRQVVHSPCLISVEACGMEMK